MSLDFENKIEVIASKRGYNVSPDGNLFNPKGHKIGHLNNLGYYQTSIRINGIKRALSAHRLQAYQKHGDQLFNKGILVRHLNGDSTDNSQNNITIGTPHDNIMDIPKELRVKKAL